jgi:ubiquinol-cytochrome c reductase cytochrome b/c1 subunit
MDPTHQSSGLHTWPHNLKRADGSGHYEPPAYKPTNPVVRWLEARLPILSLAHGTAVSYPTPRNLNYLWTFGAILTFMLVAQIVTGIVLTMHYTPEASKAFESVEHIMRDVNYGWLLRYLHANGASMFFLAAYIHIFRGMYYGSYKSPREVLWILGVIIYVLMMATGFMGYVLPWGQMSYWAAKVITNLFSAIPVVGDPIVTWLWGGYTVGNPTLNRFFALHYLLPFAIAAVVVLHIWALHVVGQNNPTGVDPKTDKETVPFSPHATIKDMFGLGVFLLLYLWFVFYIPNFLGHADNYIPANPAVTPAHIVPEWYYLPFYAILRSIPNKLLGVVALFGSIGVLALLPWLDTSQVKSARYRPLYRQFFWVFVGTCVLLGWLGSQPPEGIYVVVSRLLTAWYFIHLLVVLPLLGIFETPRPVPNSITEALRPRARSSGSSCWPWGSAPPPSSADRSRPRPRRSTAQSRRATPGRSRGRSASSTAASSSAASRCTTTSARPVTASSWWRSARSATKAGRSSPRRRSRPLPPSTRSRMAPTTRATCSSAQAVRPTTSHGRTRTSRRRGTSITGCCRRTCRCSPRRASTSAGSRGS